MRERAQRVLNVLLGTAVVVSIVHYVDNYTAFELYPQGDTGPEITKTTILVSWFVFTAFGLAGYRAFFRERFRQAAVLLAVYSGSGLIGLGHYTVPGAGDMPWWRHAHVVADIVLGTAMLAFAVWTGRRATRAALV